MRACLHEPCQRQAPPPISFLEMGQEWTEAQVSPLSALTGGLDPKPLREGLGTPVPN